MITGATSGIGKACAEKFAAGGYHLIVTGRRNDRLQELQAALEQQYAVKVLPLCFDVQNKEEVFSAISSLPDAWKQIGVLINNAGLALGRDSFEAADMHDWETMIDTNIKGLLYVSKAVLPLLTNPAGAHIINIGSIAGKQAYEKGNVYCATKSAVQMLSQTMRIDLLPHRIRVTAIHPGAVETEFGVVRFKGNEAAARKVYEGYQPLSAADIAGIIFFCTSLPPHICINDLDVTCLAQANAFYTFKG